MSVTKSWPSSGTVNVTSTNYPIPQANNVNWASLTNFLTALADGAQSTTFQRFATRVGTTTPITVSVNDCIIGSDLTAPGAVAMTLPGGVQKQVLFISDLKGDALTNNVTITPDAGETIGGAATLVLNSNYEAVMIAFQSSDNDWKIIGRWKPNASGILPSQIALANGSVLIGNVSNVAAAQTISGAITTTNAGVTTISNDYITDAMINSAAAVALSKLAALTFDRALISSGAGVITVSPTTALELSYVNGVTSSIQAQIDAKFTNPLTTTGDMVYASNTATPATAARLGIGTVSQIMISTGTLPSWGLLVNANVDAAAGIVYSKLTLTGSIVNADIGAAAAIAYSKLATLTSGNILVGSAGNVATSVAMSGDATIIASGALTIANGAITNAKVSASAAIDFSKLATLSSGNILVGSAGNVATSVAMTGDITISSTGVTAIGSGVIVNADVSASAAIDGTKIVSAFGSQTITNTDSSTVLNTIGNTGGYSSIYSANSATGSGIAFSKSRGTIGSKTIVQSGDTLGSINFLGYESSSGVQFAARITAEVDGTPGASSDMPGRIVFLTTPDGSATLAERMRIDNAGLVTIGTAGGSQIHVVNGELNVQKTVGVGSLGNTSLYITAPTNPTTTGKWQIVNRNDAGSQLHFINNGNIWLYLDTAGNFQLPKFTGGGSTTATIDNSGFIVRTSDAVLKNESKDAHIPGLAEVLQLRPVAYKWKNENTKGASTEIGFFANEVAKIIPSAAPKGSDGVHGFYDRSVIAALVKAVQELKAELDLKN